MTTRGKPTLEGYIDRVKTCQFYATGEQFTTSDIASTLSNRSKTVELHTAHKILTEMASRGDVQMVERAIKGVTRFDWKRRRPSLNLARMPWRKYSDAQLGIEAPC